MALTVAFFDLDYTILDTSSGLEFARATLRSGRIRFYHLPYLAWLAGLYTTGLLDYGRATAGFFRLAWPEGEAALQAFAAGWAGAGLLPHVTDPARQKIAEHRAQGHHPLILSAATPYIVGPVARHLGLNYLCTRLTLNDGKFDGEVEPPTCYGPGKIVWAERWAQARGSTIDWAASYFYSDSHSDLPLLRRVGNPVAVNPDRRLRRVAVANGWPILKFY
ncbi:MAG: HAD family hydrolase [Anaerolineae bacterium]